MQVEEFRTAAMAGEESPAWSGALRGLARDARGAWEHAHEAAQDDTSDDGSWVHAYLHRKEGDLPNADYWYRRAGRRRPESSLEEEWEAIARALLAAS